MQEISTGREFKNLIYSELSRIGKAVADPKRLEILDLLCQAEKNVELISKETGMSIAAASHHLQILKDAKLISDRRDGRFIHYKITASGIQAWTTISNIGETSIAEIKISLSEFFDSRVEIEELEYDTLFKKVSNTEILLIDVRPDYEYAAANIPGSISIPLHELKSRLDKLPKRKKIVAYCRGKYCVLSKEAVAILRKKGFSAYRLPIGVLDYQDLGYNVHRSN